MARLPRLVIPGQPLHVIQRGNNRSVSFSAVEDYRYYKAVLREASVRARCAIHAYVLMSNHVHLLVTPAHESGPARMMQALGRRYVRYFNDRYGRTGTLWEGRYRSTPIDSHRYFLACSRYIELNPVRAGLTSHPGRYAWSSYRHNAHGEPDPVVTPHALYRQLGAQDSERRSAYRALFERDLDADALDAIRRPTRAGTVLGVAHLQATANEPLERRPGIGAARGCRRIPEIQAARQ